MKRAIKLSSVAILLLCLTLTIPTNQVNAQAETSLSSIIRVGHLNLNQNPEIFRETLNQLPQTGQETAIPILPVTVSTPDDDGIIIHVVQYGETLYTISEAYGVPMDVILNNSNLNPSTTDILEGWRLTIQTATEPTPVPTNTATLDPGTPTPTQPRPTRTPFPTRTPAPTFTPTSPPSMIHRTLGNAKNVGIGLILVSGMGLALVIYLGFLKKS